MGFYIHFRFVKCCVLVVYCIVKLRIVIVTFAVSRSLRDSQEYSDVGIYFDLITWGLKTLVDEHQKHFCELLRWKSENPTGSWRKSEKFSVTRVCWIRKIFSLHSRMLLGELMLKLTRRIIETRRPVKSPFVHFFNKLSFKWTCEQKPPAISRDIKLIFDFTVSKFSLWNKLISDYPLAWCTTFSLILPFPWSFSLQSRLVSWLNFNLRNFHSRQITRTSIYDSIE